MSLFPHRVELLIDQLENTVPAVEIGAIQVGKIERHDWRPVWDLCTRIQDEFKGCRDFPSREAHQAAWKRFQEIRQQASALCDKEKSAFRFQSEQFRNDILSDVRACSYSAAADALFFFDPTTVEDMKQLSEKLNDAARRLSKLKHWMLANHKTACFEAIQEVRQSHDLFWEKRRQSSRIRQHTHEERRAEIQQKKEDRQRRVHANIDRNRDRLSKALSALDRNADHIREIEEKLSETTSPKWAAIFSEWLAEAHQKERDIEDSIDQIKSWIREDEDKLSS